jgi:hypothetical protein
MALVLIEAGAELNEPFVAAASMNNKAVAELLLDRGAVIDGTGEWSPVEEALYWDSQDVLQLLLTRGAKVRNLRVAAGLGRTDLIESFFNTDDSLKPEAGKINWPWGTANLDRPGKQHLAERVKSWSQDRQGIINNAFVYACMHGHTTRPNSYWRKAPRSMSFPGDLITPALAYITRR